MNFGNVIIWLAFAASVSAFVTYTLVSAGRQSLRDTARFFYGLASVLVFSASVLLLAMFLGNRFDVNYVKGFSSFHQPLVYKISAFWGGQEGSWLLWLTWISFVGLLLHKRADRAEGPVMAFWSSVQIFFLTILLLKSPFAPTPEPVQDGFGLNPLLQNYWMAIHPPILFLGFTLTCVPAAFAVAALIQRDFSSWGRLVFGWTVLGWTILGVGLLLGGVWAYETLGWGGWWGWDPVENASLVPWLVGGGLVHGLLIERTKNSWKKLNLFLAMACFILVIYATFLTRSGVLGDFSVHSFAALDSINWLLGFLLGYLAFFIGLLVLRSRYADEGDEVERISAKEMLVFLGIVLFGLAGILVALGMSSPLLTRLFADKPGNVPTLYYYRVTTPVALGLMGLVGFSPLVSWARERTQRAEGNRVWAGLLGLALLFVLSTAVFTYFRVGAEYAARLAVAGFAGVILVPNLWSLADCIRSRGWRFSGGHVAHVGVSVLFIGIIASTANNKLRPDQLSLASNTPQMHLGMKWTFVGVGDSDRDGRQPFNIRIEDSSGKSFVATPVMQTIRDGSLMRHPYIKASIGGDLYIAPVELATDGVPPHADIKQGTAKTLGPWKLTFNGFGGMEHTDDGNVRAEAKILVSDAKGGPSVELKPAMLVTPGGMQYEPARIPGSKDSLMISGINVGGREVSVVLDGPQWRQAMSIRAVVEVTYKPVVWVLWLGAALIALGGFISSFRRIGDAGRARMTLPEQNP